MTSREEELKAKHISWMTDTEKNAWTHWPILPLVNRQRTNDAETGILIDDNPIDLKQPKVKPIVYRINMFDSGAMKNWKNAPKEEYDSTEAMYEDGWRVD